MLTFRQFVTENRADAPFGNPSHSGFIKHGNLKHVIKGNPDDDSEDTHDAIAWKHNLSRHKYGPAQDAVKKGHVRYYHEFDNNNKGESAGYEFKDTPKHRKAVSAHLGKSRGFPEIYIDQRHPKTGEVVKSNRFPSVEAARKHLDEQTSKGWMSPKGDLHMFPGGEEHERNHHPKIANKVHTMTGAMEKGYARFRTDDGSHVIHYDQKSRGGAKAALHTLKHLKPHTGDKIWVTHRPWSVRGDHDHDFKSPGEAARHIKKLDADHKTKTKADDDELLNALKENDSEPPAKIKGWMSPKGDAHYFKDDAEHSTNHHPDIAKKIQPEINKAFSAKYPTKQHHDAIGPTDHYSNVSINTALKHGHARFGKHYGAHYVHYDHKSKGGTQAALHALKALNLRHGSSVIVTHKPWKLDHEGDHDSHFTSPSEAAAHIRKHKPVE